MHTRKLRPLFKNSLLTFSIVALHFYAVLNCLSPQLTSGAISTTSSCYTARRAPAPSEVHEGVQRTALVDKCIPTIDACVLRAPFTSCLEPSQLVNATNTLVLTHQVAGRRAGRLGCRHQRIASR
jgi:hypothetical protein